MLNSSQLTLAREVFNRLGRVNFNHAGRADPQQSLLEPLEIVAVATGLKRAFCAGQSSHESLVLRTLSKLAGTIGLTAATTKDFDIFTQLRALPDTGIPSAVLSKLSESIATTNGRKDILWLFLESDGFATADSCANGTSLCGDFLEYPRCCTRWYLAQEAERVLIEFQYFQRLPSVRNEDDICSHFERQTPLDPASCQNMEKIDHRIRTTQASSIRQFPFVHFIACPSCLETDSSPAALQNDTFRTLAMTLSPTFARKFVAYSEWYWRLFVSRTPEVKG